ncbi:MAG: Crp/Fnr family transcriptional regulator [Treponema sp.]|nr:Crp/Fnr family transcriptional regulator [Treponema sp.]
MPKPLQYNAGSLIYRMGEDSEKVFILQKGKVSLVYADIETGNDIREQVLAGEFFGVKSAFGRYPREENAIATSDSTIIVFTIPEFEALALSNSRIVLKMLKVFSSQLRRVHNQISKVLETESVRPDEGLFALGEKFMKLRRFEHAKYAFNRYLSCYPTGRRADQAQKNLNQAVIALASESKGPPRKTRRN